MAIFTEAFCYDLITGNDSLSSMNEAQFHFLPKFEEDPAVAKYMRTLEEAEDILNDNDMDPKVGFHRTVAIIYRVFDIILNISSIGSLISCITIVGIIFHLYLKLMSWESQTIEQAAREAEGGRVIAKMKKLVATEQDPSKKVRYQETLDKMIAAHDKYLQRRNF